MKQCARIGCPSKVDPNRDDVFCSSLCHAAARADSRLKHLALVAERRGRDLSQFDERFDALQEVFRAIDKYRSLFNQPPEPKKK